MTEQELNQFRKDIEDLLIRLRQVESLEAPFLKSVYERFIDLINRVKTLESQGTPIRLENMAKDIEEIKADQKAIRVTVRSTLITSAASILTSLILFAILRAIVGSRG